MKEYITTGDRRAWFGVTHRITITKKKKNKKSKRETEP